MKTDNADSQRPTSDTTTVYRVSELNDRAKRLLEKSFSDIWLEGEISRPTIAASGHAYFTLKDDSASISCACFKGQLNKSQCQPEEGLQILARGRVSIYTARGNYQFIVSYMEEAGQGALQKKFDALKKKLFDEGLFEAKHKKPLPVLPHRVGLITSASGAVVHDMITTFRKRFPMIALRVYPVSVQGDSAPLEIVKALELAGKRQDCDALILARGGGSLEDLMAFNDENVARAVFACSIPIVCGVGHEPDVSIADFVADHRAATPTAAAEALSPDRSEWVGYFQNFQRRFSRVFRDRLEVNYQRVDLTRKRLLHPKSRLRESRRRTVELTLRIERNARLLIRQRNVELLASTQRLNSQAPANRLRTINEKRQRMEIQLKRRMTTHLADAKTRLNSVRSRLTTVSPLATLDRGYAILQKDAAPDQGSTPSVIRNTNQVTEGDTIRARVAVGELRLNVEKIEKTRQSSDRNDS